MPAVETEAMAELIWLFPICKDLLNIKDFASAVLSSNRRSLKTKDGDIVMEKITWLRKSIRMTPQAAVGHEAVMTPN